MTLWSFLNWFFDNWLLIIWGACILGAYIYGGRTIAFAVLTLGVGIFAYNRGKSDVNKHAKDVQEKRENAYEQIKNRGTDRNDVIERLRKSTF